MKEEDYLKYLELEDLTNEQRDLAETITIKKYIDMMKYFGGWNIYIHKPERTNISVRNRLIRADFDGYNYRDLAMKYNLSTNSIRKIIKS